MALGHIKLGAPGALRSYILLDPKQRSKVLANLMAAKLGTGGGDYNEMQNWSYWVTEGLRRGVGRVDPMDGGFWYSDADTRFEKRLMLSPLLRPTGIKSSDDSDTNLTKLTDIDQVVTIGGDGNPEKIALPFNADGDVTSVWFYLLTGYQEAGATVTIMSGSTPTSTVTTGSASSSDEREGWTWRHAAVSFTASSATQYWCVIEPPEGGTLTLPTSTVAHGAGVAKKYESSSWSDLQTDGSVDLYGFVIANAPVMGAVQAAHEFNGTIYCGDDNGDVWKWDSANDLWSQVGTTLAAGVTDVIRWQGDLYVAIGSSNNARKITTGDSVSDAGFVAEKFLVWQGYLWRSSGNNLYYNTATDLSTWSAAITVGPNDYDVVGLAGLGENIIVSTEQALWSIGFGDWVSGLSLWGYYDDDNGAGMISWQGSLFAPQGNAIHRYMENAPILDIWNREDRLPSERQGKVVSLVGTNRELMACIDPTDSSGSPTIWSWNQEGWHHMATLPAGTGGGPMVYDRYTECVWVFDKSGFAWTFRAPTTSSTPVEDTDAEFMPDGWLDTGVYYGGLRELEKDWDSISIVGEAINSNTPVECYYRTPTEDTEDITTEAGNALETEGGLSLYISENPWILLGTFDDNHQKIRWTDYDKRPTSTGLRIALRLKSTDTASTPVVRSVIARYHPMVSDRWRWNLPIVVSDFSQTVDGERLSYSYAQQKTHLESMILDRVKPFIYEDVDGEQYEVKCVETREQLTEFEYFNGEPHLSSVYWTVVEQIVPEEYAAS